MQKTQVAIIQAAMGMGTAAQSLNIQSDIKAADLEAMIYSDYTKPEKLRWSTSATAPYTTIW